MAVSPNTENYTLGRGRLYFAPYDSNGNMLGERALGNAPAFTFSLATEKLEHFSSMTGLKVKDKTVVTQVTPSVSFTLDEMSEDNVEMLFMGESTTVSQSADDDILTALTDIELDRWYSLGNYRNAGIIKMVTSSKTGDWAAGDTVTGGSSSQTATVQRVDASALLVTGLSGAFTPGESLGNGSTGAATLVGSPAMIYTDFAVANATDTVIYDLGDDYSIDSTTARIFFKSTGALVAGDDPKIYFGVPAASWTQIDGLRTTFVEGQLRFVSDYPEGPNMVFTAWKVNLSPDGDTAFIGDDWSTMQFTGEILADEENHPTTPYCQIVM